jgi:hypothetical protein
MAKAMAQVRETVANLGRFIRKLFGGAQSGAVSEPVSLNATVGDLRNLQYGGEFDSDKAAATIREVEAAVDINQWGGWQRRC